MKCMKQRKRETKTWSTYRYNKSKETQMSMDRGIKPSLDVQGVKSFTKPTNQPTNQPTKQTNKTKQPGTIT